MDELLRDIAIPVEGIGVADLTSWAVLVAFTVGFTEGVKRTVPSLESRWYPLIALFWGIVFTVGATYGSDLILTVMLGAAVALAAMGLFSGVKATFARGD